MKKSGVLHALSYSKKFFRYQIFPLIVSPFFLLFSVVRPFLIRYLIDDVVGKNNYNLLLLTAAGLVVVTFLESLFSLLVNYAYYRAANKAVGDEQKRLFMKIIKAPLKSLSSSNTGDLMSRILYDVPEMMEVLGIAVAVVLVNILTLFLIAGVLIYFNWKLAVTAFAMMPFYYVAQKIFSKPLKESARVERERYSAVTESLREKVEGAMSIKGLNKFSFFLKLFSKDVESWVKARNRLSFYTTAEDQGLGFVASLTPVLVLGLGGYLIMKGQLTLGTLIGFYSYLGWLYTPIRTLSSFFVSLQKSSQMLERIREIYDLPEEKSEGDGKITTVEEVSYDDVHFSYSGEKFILNGVKFKVKNGESVAIVGLSGSGKSTVLSLLPRFYDPQKGSVKINEKSVKEYLLENLRKNVIIVRQNDFLFNMSVRENIILDDNFSEEEFKEAVKVACVEDFINDLENGYDTIVGERGSKLSDGQRQRVAIARAVIRKPKVLILDEATSGVDSKTEERIFKNLLDLNITLIIVSHRLSTIKKAGRILVIDNGRIICEGSHENLLKNCSKYKQIIQAQIIE